MRTLYTSLLATAIALAAVSCDKGENPAVEPVTEPDAISIDLPKDSKPSSTAFDRKILLTDFTGTGCTFCPQMTSHIRSVMGNSTYQKRVVLTIAHTASLNPTSFPDPAYFSSPDLNGAMGITAWPTIILNLNKKRVVNLDNVSSAMQLQQQIDAEYNAASAQVGICAGSEIKDDKINLRVQIKSGTEAPTYFRIGAWILEDGLKATQSGTKDESYFTHDKCVRALAGYSGSNFSGDRYEKALSSGETGEATFTFNLGSSWNKNNLSYVVFVSTPDADGNYYVNNAASAKIGNTISYLYK